MADEHAETANVSVRVVPDLSVMRSMLLDMVAVIDKYDDGEQSE